MPLMLLPVLDVFLGQGVVPNDKGFIGSLIFCSLGEIEEPVMTVSPSIIMILLWAISWAESIFTGIPAFATKGAEVKEYA